MDSFRFSDENLNPDHIQYNSYNYPRILNQNFILDTPNTLTEQVLVKDVSSDHILNTHNVQSRAPNLASIDLFTTNNNTNTSSGNNTQVQFPLLESNTAPFQLCLVNMGSNFARKYDIYNQLLLYQLQQQLKQGVLMVVPNVFQGNNEIPIDNSDNVCVNYTNSANMLEAVDRSLSETSQMMESLKKDSSSVSSIDELLPLAAFLPQQLDIPQSSQISVYDDHSVNTKMEIFSERSQLNISKSCLSSPKIVKMEGENLWRRASVATVCEPNETSAGSMSSWIMSDSDFETKSAFGSSISSSSPDSLECSRNCSTSSSESSCKGKKTKARARKCHICNCVIRRDISRHLRTHEEVSRFSCVFPRKFCGHKTGQFNRPYDFKKHLLNGHFKFDDPNGKKLHNLNDKLEHIGTCSCGMKFRAVVWLEDHILTKNELMKCPYICF